MRPSGMLTKKIQRHVAYVAMKPPSAGPITGAISPGQTMRPIASMMRSFGVSVSTMRRPTGDMNAAAMPCSRRAANSAPNVGAAPHRSEASVNTATAPAKRFLAPKRSLAQPAVGTNTVMATR